jgi:signal transduction histidine kinase
VLSIATDIEQLNNSNLATQRGEVTRRLASFRADLHRRLWRTLLLGFLVAFVAVVRLRMLERRSEEQREHAERAENEMRLLSQQLVAAQEEERKKLTRELHDHVGQMLTALRMEIGRADRARGRTGAESQLTHAIAEAKKLLDTTLRSVRDLVMGLRPSMLDDFGLQPALEWLVRDFRRRYGTPIDLILTGEIDALPDQYRTCLYRVVQEALTNCARHAHATRIEIALCFERNTLELVVSDDGTGIDPLRNRGMGLIGIEERVRELHGTVDVASRVPGGTTLRATIPVTLSLEEVQRARAAG